MLAFCPLVTPDACVRISSCSSQPHSPHHPLPTATAGDWSERCRKMLAKRNTGARLDSCLEAVGASVDAAVEQFERRLDVSGGGRWRQGGARREEGGGGVAVRRLHGGLAGKPTDACSRQKHGLLNPSCCLLLPPLP